MIENVRVSEQVKVSENESENDGEVEGKETVRSPLPARSAGTAVEVWKGDSSLQKKDWES